MRGSDVADHVDRNVIRPDMISKDRKDVLEFGGQGTGAGDGKGMC